MMFMVTRKRTLSSQEEAQLRDVLQTATLAALMNSRRWEPGDIAFQGGTSLHLAHGSARFSEDLDFLVRGGLSLKGLSREVQKKLVLPFGMPADLAVSVSPGKDERNPHSFYVTLSGPQVLGSAKVKVELWQAPGAALQALVLKVSTIRSSAGQAFVPTLTLEEIFADKVYALGGRERIKPRDVFDVWWLCEQGTAPPTAQALLTRLAIYPASSGQQADTAAAWLDCAQARLSELQAPTAATHVLQDLRRWLPSSWPIGAELVGAMLGLCVQHLGKGMADVRTLPQLVQGVQEPRA